MIIVPPEIDRLDVSYLGPGYRNIPCLTPEEFQQKWDQMGFHRYDEGNVPRLEAWFNTIGADYRYGSGTRSRLYHPREYPEWIDRMRQDLNQMFGVDYNCCFVNGYEDHRDNLGYHADDSPEMNPDHPIAIVSYGAERELWFRRQGHKGDAHEKYRLEHGSVLLMHEGTQQKWFHRIPKHSQPCGPRMSLTFRNLLLEAI